MSSTEDVERLGLLGERLCLDFTNTIGQHPRLPTSKDFLNCYDNLISWSQYVKLLGEDDATRLRGLAATRPDEAEQALRKAVMLRETIYRILSAESHQSDPDRADMHTLHQALSAGLPQMQLVRCDGTYQWAWAGDADDLARMLWPVAWDAAELLKSEQLHEVRECAGETCNWLFLDTSRNHSRQWCDMKSCGNRAKARRHYQRERAGTSE